MTELIRDEDLRRNVRLAVGFLDPGKRTAVLGRSYALMIIQTMLRDAGML